MWTLQAHQSNLRDIQDNGIHNQRCNRNTHENKQSIC